MLAIELDEALGTYLPETNLLLRLRGPHCSCPFTGVALEERSLIWDTSVL